MSIYFRGRSFDCLLKTKPQAGSNGRSRELSLLSNILYGIFNYGYILIDSGVLLSPPSLTTPETVEYKVIEFEFSCCIVTT